MRKRRTQTKFREANSWWKGLTNEQLARFVSTHDLSKVMGTGRPAEVEFAPEVLDRTQEKHLERVLVALRLERRDLERIRQIARDQDIPYTALMRSWIRAGLRRERRKAG